MQTAKYILNNAETKFEEVQKILIELHKKGETVEEILDFVQVLESRKIIVEIPQNWKVFDVCGTGGSGKNRINLSTALTLKLSKEFKIAKHGNKASSGKIGSFDLIEKFGLETADTSEKVIKNLEEKNYAFVFAPAFHPALKHLAPIRKSISHPTIFNFLGPLLNPISTLTAQMIGLPNPQIGDKLAEVALKLGKNVLFVHDAAFGLDDVSIGGETIFWKIKDGKMEKGTFVPEDLGIERVKNFEVIAGGNLETNMQIFEKLISGKAPKSHQYFLEINYLVAKNFFNEFIK